MSGWNGELTMYAGTVNEEPNELDNQGRFINQSSLFFFSSVNKVSFQTEHPSLSQVSGYGKYAIPYLYLSLETTDYCQMKISAVFGYDALKNTNEI